MKSPSAAVIPGEWVGAKKSTRFLWEIARGARVHRESGHRHSRRFDDLLARGRQPGQRQNRSRFARRRVQRRFLEPEVKLVTAAVAWERRCWRLAFRTVCRTGDLDMKMLGVTIPGTHLVKPGAISSSLAAQRLLDRGID